MTKDKYDCSFSFDDLKERKKYKYVVIRKGDLDLNGAMMLRSQKCIKAYLKEQKECLCEPPLAIIKIEKFV